MRTNTRFRHLVWCAASLVIFSTASSITAAQQHRVIFTKVHSKALEGNLLGDSPDRKVTVHLPPEYDQAPMKRFPVVYLLHGLRNG